MSILKSLRAPDQLFRATMWVVSVVFAGFLIGLGGKIVGDLPGVKKFVTPGQFEDSAAVARLNRNTDSLKHRYADASEERDRAALRATSTENAYRSARQSFDSWVATRTATTDPRQDPEVIRRNRALDTLQARARSAQAELERLDAQRLLIDQAMGRDHLALDSLREAAMPAFNRAYFWQEMQVFLIRLALTLPLLLIAAWLVLRKRKSEYWPLWRGFVLFGVYTFFVELVPYLPSWGGYVRYTVGVIASGMVGLYVIRAMGAYLVRRRELAQQGEADRRRALDRDTALGKMDKHLCPGCERAIAGAPEACSTFCVHCGMRLFDSCPSCGAKRNVFFSFCPACGIPAPPLQP